MVSDIGWSIQCPDKCIRYMPYIEKDDAEFDAMYISARGCFDYSNNRIKQFDPPCPQGNHEAVMSMFDCGDAIDGAMRGPCDIEGCVRRSKWRAGLSINSIKGDVVIKCNIAIKTCNLHRRGIAAEDIVSEREWELISEQFCLRGITLPTVQEAELFFQKLHISPHH